MQLQEWADAFDDAGVALYALSYDEPDALADFRDEFGLTFPLLSDPDSEVIRAFGILNTLVPEDDHPWYGMPFPGSYVTDAAGVIRAKSFERHLAVRATGEQLLRAALGEGGLPAAAAAAHETVADVAVSVTASDAPLPHGQQRDLHVRLRVPPGQHVYGEPVPDGMVATHVEFDDGVESFAVDGPPTHAHVLAGTGETLHVYEGDVHLVVPFAVTGRHQSPTKGMHRIEGSVRFQACDDEACGLPQAVPFALDIPMARQHAPHFSGASGGQMDFAAHFTRMTERRSG